MAVAGLYGSGCTSTEPVTAPPPEIETIRDLESESRDQSATLTLVYGQTLEARAITVGTDSIRWDGPSTSTRHALPIGCVQTVRFRRHGLGMLEGVGIGLGVSLGAGLLTATLPSALGQCEGLGALACGLAGMAVTVGGTLIGTVVGAVRGHHDVYRFPKADPASSGTCQIHASESSAPSVLVDEHVQRSMSRR